MKEVGALNEKRIKTLLARHLRDTGEAKGARVLRELCVAGFSRRADVVLVNGNLAAFEIKGENDNLARLPGQISTFSDYFEFLTIVCASRHTENVLATVPASVGVWEVTGEQIDVVRSAAELPKQDKSIWLSYLPVRALSAFLSQQGIKAHGRQRDRLLAAAEGIPTEDVRQAALTHLKSRERVAGSGVTPSARRRAIDPVSLRLEQVKEYLDLMKTEQGCLKAMPRRPASTRRKKTETRQS